MKIITKNILGLKTTVGIPSGYLGTFVDKFFELEGSPGYRKHRIIPSGTSEILFNLGDSIYGRSPEHSSAGNDDLIFFGRYIISGVKTRYFDSIPSERIHFVGIKFKIDGMKKLFDISPAELADNDRDLDIVIPKTFAEDTLEKLDACPTSQVRLKTMAGLLQNKLATAGGPNTLVNEILKKPFLKVKQLESETGFSRQYLHRVFKSETGISIKKYQKIRRISGVLNSSVSGHNPFTTLAYENGYFDQSHFIKDFKEITGFTPASYFTTRLQGTDGTYFF